MRKEEPEVFKAKAGLDEEDFNDQEVQELLEVYDEVKHGLEDSSEENDEDDEEEGEDEGEDDVVDAVGLVGISGGTVCVWEVVTDSREARSIPRRQGWSTAWEKGEQKGSSQTA